ncbi:hypothetical protein Tco_0300703 [Tanacetum coccineum]
MSTKFFLEESILNARHQHLHQMLKSTREGSATFPSNDLGCSDVKKKYRAGRDAFKLTKDIKALIEESNKIIFDKLRVVEQEVRCRRRVVEKEVRWKRRVVEEEVRWRRKVMEEEGWRSPDLEELLLLAGV